MITEKEAKKRLKILLEKVEREKHPSYPEHLTIATKKYDVRKANGLTQAVIAWIEAHGQRAIRVSSAGRYIDKSYEFTDVVGFNRRVNTGTWVKGTTKVGAADISCTIYGESVEIEIKIGRDKQSAEQKEYQRIQEQAGGIYIIIKTLEQFLEWWDEFITNLK